MLQSKIYFFNLSKKSRALKQGYAKFRIHYLRTEQTVKFFVKPLLSEAQKTEELNMPTSKVLVVDDEPDLQEIYTALLGLAGVADVIVVDSARSAIQAINEHKQALTGIICDYSMPGGTGAIVLKHNLATSKLPFCLVSGGFPESLPDLSEITFDGQQTMFIAKPIDEESLLRQIKDKMFK